MDNMRNVFPHLSDFTSVFLSLLHSLVGVEEVKMPKGKSLPFQTLQRPLCEAWGFFPSPSTPFIVFLVFLSLLSEWEEEHTALPCSRVKRGQRKCKHTHRLRRLPPP